MNKQIEEMARLLEAACTEKPDISCSRAQCSECRAIDLYNAGYRKQSEGEWEYEHETYGKILCSNCKGESLLIPAHDHFLMAHFEYVYSNFCPHCGARMKGENNDT